MRIKAFTLLEVTIAMLISAICIGVCFAAYGIIGHYYASFQKKNQLVADALALRQVLERDFLNSSMVVSTGTGIELTRDSSTLRYTFTENGVYREVPDIHTDTFRLVVSRPVLSFERRVVEEPDTLDRIEFEIALGKGQMMPIVVQKYYSAVNLFK